jgi:hypothetical protein
VNIQQRHDELLSLRRNHPAWRLLAADNASLVLGFCEQVFLEPNIRQLPGPALIEKLEDHLHELRRLDIEAAGAVTHAGSSGDEPAPKTYPRTAEAYIAEWSDPQTGWLRRTYPTRPNRPAGTGARGGTKAAPRGAAEADVPHYEPTSAVETAAEFLRTLGRREFLGTASRLMTVRDLLRQIAAGAANDPEVRLAALTRQRAEIDAQIAAIGDDNEPSLDPTAIRERYAQAIGTARELLTDLREVEENFRGLDRNVRRRATTWDGPRGEFLASVFGSTSEIGASDQGRSWKAFWEHLLSARQQAELRGLLSLLPTIEALTADGTFRAGQLDDLLRIDLMVAADATQSTVASLSAQLRRFLDEQTWSEGRRINDAVRTTLAAALDLRNDHTRPGHDVADLRPEISMPTERPLYALREAVEIDTDEDAPDTDDDQALGGLDGLGDLLDLTWIDIEALRAHIVGVREAHGGTASLRQVIETHPLDDGLAELVGYLQVADTDARLISDRTEVIEWTDQTGRHRQSRVPLILYGLTDQPGDQPTDQPPHRERARDD